MFIWSILINWERSSTSKTNRKVENDVFFISIQKILSNRSVIVARWKTSSMCFRITRTNFLWISRFDQTDWCRFLRMVQKDFTQSVHFSSCIEQRFWRNETNETVSRLNSFFDRSIFIRRDLLKKLFRFLGSFYSHSIVTSEYFTDKLFSNILNYIQQSKSHTFSKLTLITGAMDVLHQITTKWKTNLNWIREEKKTFEFSDRNGSSFSTTNFFNVRLIFWSV